MTKEEAAQLLSEVDGYLSKLGTELILEDKNGARLMGQKDVLMKIMEEPDRSDVPYEGKEQPVMKVER